MIGIRIWTQVSSATFSRVPSRPHLDADEDTAMLQVLAWTVNTKYQALIHDLPANTVTREVSTGKLSADGAVVEYEFVRFLPFDMETTSKVSWECAKCDFGFINADIVSTMQPQRRQGMKLIPCCIYRRRCVLMTS